jgi:hypothetical protein
MAKNNLINERNVLNAAGVSSTEIGYIRNVTAGTTAASKVVTTNSSNKVAELDVEVFKSDGAKSATQVSWSYAAGASNVTTITASLLDGANTAVSDVQELLIWLSDDSGGDGLTATTASGAVSVTTGTQLSALTAKKALLCLTDSNGQVVFTITDTAKTGFYPCAKRPLTGRVDVGDQLVTGDYGA